MLKTEDIRAAKLQYKTIIQQQPDHQVATLNLALIELDQGYSDEAQKLFESLLAADAFPQLSHFYLGQIAKYKKNYPAAEYYFLQVDESNRSLAINEHLTDIYIQQKSYDKAQRLIDKFLASDLSTNERIHWHLLQAQLYQHQAGQHDAARQGRQEPAAERFRNRALRRRNAHYGLPIARLVNLVIP